MSDRAIGLTFSALIHLLLIAVFAFSFFKEKLKPPSTVVLDVVMIGEVRKEKKSQQIHHEVAAIKSDQLRHYHSENQSNNAKDAITKVVPIANPLPQIPDDLRAEAFSSEAIARFYVDATGNVERVELIRPCANPRLNNLLLKSLRQWKFSAAKNSSTQDVRVKFRVE